MNTELFHSLHIVATTLLVIIFLISVKATISRPRLIWLAAFVLCTLAYCFRVFSIPFTPLYLFFNALEYFAPVIFVICIRLIFLDNVRFGKIEKVSAMLLVPLLAASTYSQLSGARLIPSTILNLFQPEELKELSVATLLFNHVLWVQLLIVVLCVISAFWLASRDWYSDLVDKRRMARRLFVFFGGPIILLIITLHAMGLIWLEHSMWILSAIALVIIVSSLFFILFAFQMDSSVLPVFRGEGGMGESDEALDKEEMDPQSNRTLGTKENAIPSALSERVQKTTESTSEYSADLHLLTAYMQEKAPHKEMGLKVDVLAARIGIPEYRLRKAINHGLGFRNFNVFLNSYRIQAAKESLEQGSTDQSILDISIDAGFKSLTSFNKAFKEFTGLTPSEYRKQTL